MTIARIDTARALKTGRLERERHVKRRCVASLLTIDRTACRMQVIFSCESPLNSPLLMASGAVWRHRLWTSRRRRGPARWRHITNTSSAGNANTQTSANTPAIVSIARESGGPKVGREQVCAPEAKTVAKHATTIAALRVWRCYLKAGERRLCPADAFVVIPRDLNG